MVYFSAGCWYSIFLDAYTYSTNYLIFTIAVIITSIVFLWIYEKPQFYKSALAELPFLPELNHITVWKDHFTPVYIVCKHPEMIYHTLMLIFKRSKHSNIISPIESNEELETNYNKTLLDETNNQEAKKIQEVLPEVVDPESESSH